MELLRFAPDVHALAQALRRRGWRIAAAESCTGGLIAAACTAVAGSSDWFEGSLVVYSNAAKTRWLDVPAQLIRQHGPVSEEVALAMLSGALRAGQANLAVAVTGIAGPGGSSPTLPEGTVWLAWGTPDAKHAECLQFPGDRDAVRNATVVAALQRLLAMASA